MSDWQFSLRTLIVTITLMAIYFVASKFYQTCFESVYSHYTSAERVASLENGLSLARVSALYSTTHRINLSDLVDPGPTQNGKILRPGGFTSASPSTIKLLRERFDQMVPGDELYSFKDRNGGGVYLQFRDGKLINHPRTLYDPEQLSKLNNFPFPNVALRFGILPYYVPIALLLILVDYRLQQRRTQHPLDLPNQSMPKKV
jgi:hypothetical protein